ncbi:DUF4388 domain-containing protein [Geothermobacter hydrogeniphilus]|uniref:PatA-like N-terminal domain-containing protein n=1 Tax=Geothermobacter hydrogeniphilus TaxID=1969733 RepID=A0A1X0YDQ6_9BACT|nr:DUF4388 domain-containing protein [Geothermobacter hydrogeniphilus]ORJ63114.1 hypothetical protein B5V00_03465 [Geothermobacter hydrogeniphilus]
MSLTISSHGRINLPPGVVRELRNQPLEARSFSRNHLLLTASGEQEVCLAGVLGALGLPDLLSFFNMFRHTGVLRFRLQGGEKALYFQDGEIVFATSSFPEEELGEILFGLGKVDRETLDKARQFASSRRTIGKILVEKKAVTAKDLWEATRNQVETIVYNLFVFSEGSFSFEPRSLENEQIVRLSMGTQNLIMEGLRRIDERGLFMNVIGSLDLLPVATGAGAEGLSPAEQRLLELIEQTPAVAAGEVLRRSGLGEFDGLRLLFSLVEKKRVRMESAPEVEVDGIPGKILKIYNSALVVMYRKITDRNPRFGQEVRYFLRDLPQPFSYLFRDVAISAEGAVDGGRILGNLEGLEEGDKQKLLADGLNELLFMECLAARRDLPHEESAELVARVQEISRRVKEFIGRKT